VDADYFTGLFGPDTTRQQFSPIRAGVVRRAVQGNDQETLARLAEKCAHKVVIIGGDYRLDALDDADRHRTPLGEYCGVYLHANYIESLLAGRGLPIHKSLVGVIEILLSVTLAWIIISEALSLRWRGFWIAFLLLLPFVLSYLALFNLGLYLDMTTVFAILLVDVYLHRHEIVAHVKTALFRSRSTT
jgi:CHASE2 domain-containing sensor protein